MNGDRSTQAPPPPGTSTEQNSQHGIANWVEAGRKVQRTGVEVPSLDRRLPQRRHADVSGVWMLGVHGGAGETTLARILGTREASRSWPVPEHYAERSSVLLVARTHAVGIEALRDALGEVASGAMPSVQVVGVVLVRDAPNLPKQLRDEARIVAGAAAHTWWVPWIEQWRRTTSPTLDGIGRGPTDVLTQLRTYLDERTQP